MNGLLAAVHYNTWILTTLLALPLAGVAVLALQSRAAAGADAAAKMEIARRTALALFVVEAALSVGLWWSLDYSSIEWQAAVTLPWIPAWGIHYKIGVDGIAVVLILLTTFLMPLTVLGSWTGIREKPFAFYAMLLLMTTGMLGVFVALDLALFYVFWELMLIPMYLIIGMWGGSRRVYASIKFFLFTMLGSLLMLVAILYVAFKTGGASGVPVFDYDLLASSAAYPAQAALWLFGAFFVAFAVKVPMWPLHTWLPDAHVEAPTGGSVVLASIMLKMGTFGFIRFALPLFPSAASDPAVRTVMVTLAVIGIVYGALVSMVQPDFKKLVAYSSVSHLGFVMLGLFAFTTQGMQGAVMVNLNHGISTGALFLLIGMLYERRHTRLFDEFGGIARVMPMYAVALSIVAFSSMGLPGTNGFVGEFLVLIGAFRTVPVATTIATTVVIIAAVYLLWMVQRVIYNPLARRENAVLHDLNWREVGLLVPLVIGIFWLGIYPAPILNRTHAAANRVIERVGGVPEVNPTELTVRQ
ncbi:MAG: NADH-quinone oxidoreductase subunit M [Gemmatimonadaceae bacterium]|nr:NADH-quinone oxidoreductase subunit M [Gemmatimonadaceae bacterium]